MSCSSPSASSRPAQNIHRFNFPARRSMTLRAIFPIGCSASTSVWFVWRPWLTDFQGADYVQSCRTLSGNARSSGCQIARNESRKRMGYQITLINGRISQTAVPQSPLILCRRNRSYYGSWRALWWREIGPIILIPLRRQCSREDMNHVWFGEFNQPGMSCVQAEERRNNYALSLLPVKFTCR